MIASEALQRLGVTTSRTLSLVETGEGLYRGDEPSPHPQRRDGAPGPAPTCASAPASGCAINASRSSWSGGCNTW